LRTGAIGFRDFEVSGANSLWKKLYNPNIALLFRDSAGGAS